MVVADEGLAPVQALIRWDPAWFVAREADDRAELGLPAGHPDGRRRRPRGGPRAFLEAARLPPDAEVLGPVPLPAPARPSAEDEPDDGPRERVLIRVPREQGGELASVLRAARGVLDARRAAAGLRVQLDPLCWADARPPPDHPQPTPRGLLGRG